MIRNALLWSAVLLAAFAASAFAGEGKETKVSETISLFGGNTPALDFLYHGDCGDDLDFFVGPGPFYSSASIKEKESGMPDVTYDPYKTVGVQLSVGGGIPVSPRLELEGSMTQRAGESSFNRKPRLPGDTEAKYSGLTYSTQFGAGLRARF